MAELSGDAGAQGVHPTTMDTEVGSSIPANTPPVEESYSYFKSPEFPELVVCLAFLVAAIVFESLSVDPRQRPSSVQILEDGEYVRNLNYNEVHGNETVSDNMLILAILITAVIQLILTRLVGKLGDTHGTICLYSVSVGLTLFVTEYIKLYVGYLRPDFFNVCEPNDDYSVCTGPKDGVRSSRKSFPSGHSSLSFNCLTLLSLYLYRSFGAPSNRMYRVGANGLLGTAYRKSPQMPRIFSILAVTPLLVAIWISTSRIVDNRHFPADVVGGAVLGTSLAIFTHGLWFPPWPLLAESS